MKYIKKYESVKKFHKGDYVVIKDTPLDITLIKNFFEAIENDAQNDENFKKVKYYLFDREVDINCNRIIDSTKYTPLLWSIDLKDYPKYMYARKLIFFFINNGADVNLPDNRKMTPLMYAARIGDSAIVKKLINSGAKLDEQDKFGETAFMHAFDTRYGIQINAIYELVNAGADWFIEDNKGEYPYKKLGNYWRKVIAEKYPEQYDKVLMHINMNKYNL